MATRAQARAETQARIMAAARQEIAQRGGAGLSMRAVAREVGVVSSAVYRYFATRDALISAMIVESYGSLERALARVPNDWVARAGALRAWALAHPHEFQLVYGTPIPDYRAPAETIPAAEAVVRQFTLAGAGGAVPPGFGSAALGAQFAGFVAVAASGEQRLDPGVAAAIIAELAALVGVIGLELAGHFVGTADPADELYAALVARQVRTLGLQDA